MHVSVFSTGAGFTRDRQVCFHILCTTSTDLTWQAATVPLEDSRRGMGKGVVKDLGPWSKIMVFCAWGSRPVYLETVE